MLILETRIGEHFTEGIIKSFRLLSRECGLQFIRFLSCCTLLVFFFSPYFFWSFEAAFCIASTQQAFHGWEG